MLQQSVPSSLSGIPAGSADDNVDKMIRADIRRLKNRDHGIRRRLHDEYGLTEREMNDISVDARSGFDLEAFDALKRAWDAKQAMATAH